MERVLEGVEAEQAHGRYHPIAELGQGGTANVYLAVARGPSDFNKLVVLKVLKHELAHESSFRNMFMSEARLAARLNHANVVQTNEVIQVGGRPILVMEYLEGQTLARILARSKDVSKGGVELPLSMHLRILVDVLGGLHYSHELTDYDGTPLRVVHRDMTPQNVFVSYDGRVCVLDFGIAKLMGAAQETQTGLGIIKGKLRYMPPEQVLGTPLDRRADIFAVGVMLWEAATRDKMWRGLSDAAIMYNIVNGTIPSPRTIRPDVPVELERICMKALAFDREHRYSTAAELQSDLENYLASESCSNRVVGKFVAELFADARMRMRALVEQGLSNLNAQSPGLSTLDEWHLLPPHLLSRPRVSMSPEDPSGSATIASPPPAAYRGRLLKLAAALAMAMLVFVALWEATKAEPVTQVSPIVEGAPAPPPPVAAAPPQPQPQPEPSAAVAAPPASKPVEVHLRVRVSPLEAQLYLDDKLLPGNPYSAVFPFDARPHTLRAEADGYDTESRTVTFSEHTSIELSLEHSRKAKHKTVAAEEAPPEQEKPAVVQADAPAGRCDVPYYLDEKGIRRIKRECL